MMKRIRTALVMAMALGCCGGVAAWAADEEGAAKQASTAPLEKQEAQIKAVTPGMVVVEYTLQYDKGDAPTGGGFSEKCPLCGHSHMEGLGDVIKEERPLERAGILVDGTHVFTTDVQIHPRFIKSIAVRRYLPDGKTAKSVPAAVSAYPKEQNGTILELSAPLEGATPLAFDAKAGGTTAKPEPLSLITLSEEEGGWVMGVQSFGGALVVGEKKFINAPPGLVVDKKGTPVGVSTAADMKADDSWKGSPLQWPLIPVADMNKTLKGLEERAAKSVLKVMLNFRSPKINAGDASYRQPGEAGATVQYVLGVLTDDKTVLVLSELKPTVTARLERIKVFTDPPVEAKFTASLKDYGAFVATLEKPVSGGIPMSAATVQSLKTVAIPTAEVYLQGDKRVNYVQPRRIAGYSLGWRRNVYPELTGDTKGLFLFDPAGDMLAMPIARREKASTQEGRYTQSPWLVTPVAQVIAAVNDLKTNADPGNTPLTEDQENRLAWIGFEMQAMNPELARANNVSDQTNDGENGALVTFVYPDSPAGKAGVEPGWVLLRIEAEGQPKPIDVHVTPEAWAERPFPWDRLGELQEAYFDRVLEISPWPRAENAVVRIVTDLGFGSKYTAEFYHDGKVDKKTFTVAEGPTHFDNAPKYKDPVLGLTVKDLTYEVRRYMQKKAEDPGVIVGKIETGSRGSKAGLKPYEVITHVNDHPVANVKDFEREMKGQSEVRLSVKRMTQGRIVKVKLAAGTQPASGAAEPAATAPADKE